MSPKKHPRCAVAGRGLVAFNALVSGRVSAAANAKEVLVDLKVKHHVHALAVFPELIHVGLG